MENRLDNILVVKVGTTTLTDQGNEQLDQDSFDRIGAQVMELRALGRHVILVSSGAIAAGINACNMGSTKENRSVTDLQRYASVGWRHVLNAWAESIGGISIGELLLTRRELNRSSERNEAIAVTHNLLANDCIVVANENDAICHEEIAFGDNDTLAARLTAKIGRSSLFGSNIKLVILSDIDGVYKDVKDRSSAISTIDDLNVFAHLAQDTQSDKGRGGMKTKFAAANIVMEQGIDMWIANGRTDNAIQRSINGEIGTHFSASIAGQRISLSS